MKNKLYFRLLLILIIAAATFFIYKKNHTLTQPEKIDPVLVQNMVEDFNFSSNKEVLLVLNADYLSCSICKDNLVDAIEKINSKINLEKTAIILEKPKSGKWTNKRLTYWLSKMKIDNEIKFDSTGIIQRYIPPETSLILQLGENNRLITNHKMPIELRLLDEMFKN